jgi:Bacterial regulatory proteins, luxR family
VLPPQLAARLLQEFARLAAQPAAASEAGGEAFDLTAREKEVLDLIATGATDKEIAAQLALSLHTVKSHVRATSSARRTPSIGGRQPDWPGILLRQSSLYFLLRHMTGHYPSTCFIVALNRPGHLSRACPRTKSRLARIQSAIPARFKALT